MAIKTFKDIIQNKGYRINPEDRNIFEETDIQSFFGISSNDYIEFVLYDANDNQLPQSLYGNVRYIPLTSQNISDYFLIAEGTILQKYRLPSEYFIDAKRLIKEAGYDAGIFKTQITLINKRLGSDREHDKVWIQEISPSRTEIRVIPQKKGLEKYGELAEQYNAFVNDLEFRDDTIRNIFEYIEQVNPANISVYLKSKYSEKWVQKLVQEYNMKNIDIFCTEIYNSFLQSMIYEFTNRNSNVKDLNYGKPKQAKSSITLSINDVKNICERILVTTLDKFLSIPNVSYGSRTTDKLESLDPVTDIIRTKTSDLQFDITPVEKEIAIKINPEPTPDVISTKPILKDLLEKDIIINKDDIIPPDDLGLKPIIEQPIEITINPGRTYIRESQIINNPNFFGFSDGDMVQTITREIVE